MVGRCPKRQKDIKNINYNRNKFEFLSTHVKGNIYIIYMVFTTEGFFEVAIESGI